MKMLIRFHIHTNSRALSIDYLLTSIFTGTKPEAEIKESQGSAENKIKLDCIVTYNNQRVTKGVTWADGDGNQISDNSQVEVTLKPGTNVMKCLYEVAGWTGSRTIMRTVQVGGGSGGSSAGK